MARSALGPAAAVGRRPVARRALAVVADTGQWSGAGEYDQKPRALCRWRVAGCGCLISPARFLITTAVVELLFWRGQHIALCCPGWRIGGGNPISPGLLRFRSFPWADRMRPARALKPGMGLM